ncbi:hypothetical protein QYE76_021763 [Lolium multiflorum]|uniref:Pre-nudix hydrolase domain-containing protein n=1 Tax=Lolium multiflorum TaxID=4521 RepID=A0AAD8R8H9_LOLMU|nr:hypothetical protein QYE76_021763 [Lolium multiflorum]
MILSKRTNAVIPGTPLLGTTDVLDAFEDEYGGVVVDPTFLPNTSNAFSTSLRSSLSYWSQQGKRGVWLKILEGQADLVPIAIKMDLLLCLPPRCIKLVLEHLS